MNKKGFKLDFKKHILLNLPYFAMFYVVNKLSAATQAAKGADISSKLIAAVMDFGAAFQNPLPSFNPIDLLIGAAAAGLFLLIVTEKRKNAKKFRHGVEYGSARWGTPKDIEPYMAEKFEDNIILTQTEGLTMESRPKSGVKYARNKNIVVIGGSGSGKTRFFVKPNLMQMHSSYVVTDPKGTVLIECGKMLQKKGGYKIKSLNLINFKKSMHYNPFAYIHNEQDILKLVNTIISNTKGDGEKSGEDFWVKAERLLYTAYIGYIFFEAPKEEQNFNTLIAMINASETREDDEEFKNPIDILFERLEQKKPDHFAVKQYKKYKLAAGKTAKSILISCGARLAPFDIPALREMMSYDDMELDKLGEEKTALFIIAPETDNSFNIVTAMMYTQLFGVLCDIAENKYGGMLPVPIHFMLDEFTNIGEIPNFDKIICTLKGRNIYVSLVMQSISNLRRIYKFSDEIVKSCDNILFFGSCNDETLLLFSQLLKKSKEELVKMDCKKCYLITYSAKPMLSRKYDITKHRFYRYIGKL